MIIWFFTVEVISLSEKHYLCSEYIKNVRYNLLNSYTMNMKRNVVAACALFIFIGVKADIPPVLRTGINPINVTCDGRPIEGGWDVSPGKDFSMLRTRASEVVFMSDIDTLSIRLKEWEDCQVRIVTAQGDTALVRVSRVSSNPYESPNPALLKVAPSQMLSRSQAQFDIKALVYGLSQIHPDMFSVCRQVDFFQAVNKAIQSIPDSVSYLDLYRTVAPVVAMIGDGHTSLSFPYNNVFTRELKRLPMYVKVAADRTLTCDRSLDQTIPVGAKILSINGVSSEQMLDAMLPYVSGERLHFKLAQLSYGFPALFQMLYATERYDVEYQPIGSKKPLRHTFPAATWDEMKQRIPSSQKKVVSGPYSFTIDREKRVAVMDFQSFSDPAGMKHFADSMFTALRQADVRHLVIDIRQNGGGNSSVGDELLRYISPEPFVQMSKVLMRLTPLSCKLTGNSDSNLGFRFYETDTASYIRPRTVEEGHFTGKVYLLTSNQTFSSASSFAWAFKECGTGLVIGEETGGMNVSYGDIVKYELPVSKLICWVSYKRFWQLRADENDIHGTLPDIAVPADKAMEAVMKAVRKTRK